MRGASRFLITFNASGAVRSRRRSSRIQGGPAWSGVHRHANGLAANNATGPGGHRGATLQSSAAGSHPHTGSSDKSPTGPAKTKLRPGPQSVLTQKGAMCVRFSDACVVCVAVLMP
jgi:hypothetical protein